MATRLQCAYLMVGTDELKRGEALRRLRARLDPSFAVFNLDELVGASVEGAALVASLNTLPVGDTMRLVIVSGADRLTKDAAEALITYLRNPNESTVLALVADKLAKNTRLYKAVAALGPRTVIDCAPKRRWELPAQLVRMASARGVALDRDAAQELVARLGESTTLLNTQLQTLAELCRERGHVSLADVEAHVARVAEVQPWDLLDAACARNAAKALELYALMRKPSQVALVAMLAVRLRELVCAKSLTVRGQAAQLAHELGRQAWQVKNHAAWARAFETGELEGLLVRCADCDAALKGGADPDIAFSELLVAVCTRTEAVRQDGADRGA